jgi:arachidonate 15-lipoxygenase
MNPSRYQLPQHVSADRLRARTDTLAHERQQFEWDKRDHVEDDPQIRDGATRLLPPTVKTLPPAFDFPRSMQAALVADTVRTTAIEVTSRLTTTLFPLRSERDYRRLFDRMGGTSDIFARWKEDTEFGRQRMTGVNPMHLTRCRGLDNPDLERAALYMLNHIDARRRAWTFESAVVSRRLFMTDYAALADPRIQECAQRDLYLAAPTCVFWADDRGDLVPLAIQLKPQRVREKNPVFTPLHSFADWMIARAHAQSADAHFHESPYHLLETHLVNGVIAMAMHRELHPDHPLRQLIAPHYDYTLAINKMADENLLRPNGSIDNGLTGRVRGALRAAQIFYTNWRWDERTLERDLEHRGVDDPDTLPQYYYRDDATKVNDAIKSYASAILRLWYRSDADVVGDVELQAFLRAVGDDDQGAVPGFPRSVLTVAELSTLAAEMIFRAGPQHAAVNNGQFDAYGWILGTPGTVSAAPPDAAWEVGAGERTSCFNESALWRAMPDPKPALAQMGMVWILSRPTRRSLLQAGDSPAFHPTLCFEADDIIGAFRRRLNAISESIQKRNERIQRPYRYLDPTNISRSTDI